MKNLICVKHAERLESCLFHFPGDVALLAQAEYLLQFFPFLLSYKLSTLTLAKSKQKASFPSCRTSKQEKIIYISFTCLSAVFSFKGTGLQGPGIIWPINSAFELCSGNVQNYASILCSLLPSRHN